MAAEKGNKLRKQYARMVVCLVLLILAVMLITVFAAMENPPEILAWVVIIAFASILPLIGLLIFHTLQVSRIKREAAEESGDGMTRREYRNMRADFIRTIGIIMLALGIFTAVFGGLHTKIVHDRSTAVTTGTVVGERYESDDDGKQIRKAEISYTLPDGHWLVRYESDLEIGSEVNVYYNPDNPKEKYIEGLEESPFYYIVIGAGGAVIGAAVILVSRLINRKPVINDVIDIVDRGI